MHPDWLSELVAHCFTKGVGFCGPRIVHPATSRIISLWDGYGKWRLDKINL